MGARRRRQRHQLSERLTALVAIEPGLLRRRSSAVHAGRVASRRLLVALDALVRGGGGDAVASSARALKSSLGPLRDAQVLAAWHRTQQLSPPVLEALRAAAEARAAPATATLSEVLARWQRESRAFRRWLDTAPPDRLRPWKAVRLRMRHWLERLAAQLASPERLAAPARAHALRKKVRTVRYLAEVLAPHRPAAASAVIRLLSGLQERMGALQDVDVRLALVGGLPSRGRKGLAAELEALELALHRERDALAAGLARELDRLRRRRAVIRLRGAFR